MSEKKKYDSQAVLTVHNAYLTADAKAISPEFTKLRTVLTSRQEKHSDLWVEIIPRKFDANIASYLKKGDMVSFEGFPIVRVWGDEAKQSYEVIDAKLFLPPPMLATLKARGWVPGGGKTEAAAVPAKKPVAKKAPVKIIDPDDPDDGDL